MFVNAFLKSNIMIFADCVTGYFSLRSIRLQRFTTTTEVNTGKIILEKIVT